MLFHRNPPPVIVMHEAPPPAAHGGSSQGSPPPQASSSGGGISIGKILIVLLAALVGSMFGGAGGAIAGAALGFGADLLGGGGDGSITGTLGSAFKRVKGWFSKSSDTPEQAQDQQLPPNTPAESSWVSAPGASPNVAPKAGVTR